MEKAPKFLVLRDQRGEGRYLRASWHGDTRSIVLSHWSDEVCTASTRLTLADTPKLIGFIVDALHQAATAPVAELAPAEPGRRAQGAFSRRARAWVDRILATAKTVVPRVGPGPGLAPREAGVTRIVPPPTSSTRPGDQRASHSRAG